MSLMALEAVTWHILAFCQNLRKYNTFAYHQDIFCHLFGMECTHEQSETNLGRRCSAL